MLKGSYLFDRLCNFIKCVVEISIIHKPCLCRSSLIDKKTEPDKDLAIEVQRNWGEIASGRLQFDRLQREAAALLNVEKEDLLDFWKRIYSGNGRRVLVTELIPRQGAASSPAPPLLTGFGDNNFPNESYVLGIDDIENFRQLREKQRPKVTVELR